MLRDMLMPFMLEFQFELKDTSDNILIFQRQIANNIDSIGLGFVDHLPESCWARFSITKRISKIEDIMAKINKRIDLSPSITKESVTLAFGETSILGKAEGAKRKMMDIYNKETLKKRAQSIAQFIYSEGLNRLEKYNNLPNLDFEINGKNFWESDWQKPFNLGGNFRIKRLVIAKLAGRDDWETVVTKNYDAIDNTLKKQGNNEKIDRNDLQKPIPYAVNYLSNLSIE